MMLGSGGLWGLSFFGEEKGSGNSSTCILLWGVWDMSWCHGLLPAHLQGTLESGNVHGLFVVMIPTHICSYNAYPYPRPYLIFNSTSTSMNIPVLDPDPVSMLQ